MQHLKTIVITGLMVLLVGTAAHAHMLWFNVSDHTPEKGDTVSLEIGFGHHFPNGEEIKAGRLKPLEIITPDGRSITAKEVYTGYYTFTPEQEGVYWVGTAMKPGFVSNTTTGRKLGSRKTLDNVVSCFAYRIMADTLVCCGASEKTAIDATNESLEIVPLQNPVKIDNSRNLSVKVLFEGTPLAGVDVTATRQGLEKEEIVKAITDSKGNALLALNHEGPWMLMARHKKLYPDKAECDEYSYCKTLTIQF
ncbi:MAG: DUF4198 domain-containing protein [Thermodesulfobacteriota bacterium]|nr:DUF4198 domain-containing protein [Thermodesulfobacteriota bacterium]